LWDKIGLTYGLNVDEEFAQVLVQWGGREVTDKESL
jgi:hypothetical protein